MCGCSSNGTTTANAGEVAGTIFAVADMTCTHCVGTIRNALTEGMPDTEFAIDLESHRVTVAGDAAKAEAIIRDAGYEPVLVTR